jgi:hypothetical protein
MIQYKVHAQNKRSQNSARYNLSNSAPAEFVSERFGFEATHQQRYGQGSVCYREKGHVPMKGRKICNGNADSPQSKPMSENLGRDEGLRVLARIIAKAYLADNTRDVETTKTHELEA